MKRILVILIVNLLLILSSPVLAKTPYHSLDENNFYQVARALDIPEKLASYCVWEFEYVSDHKQFGREYRQSAEEMFSNKKGDCDDYGGLQKEVLIINNYPAELWVAGSDIITTIEDKEFFQGHAICVFPYQGKWSYMQNGESEEEILRNGFASEEEATKSIYKERTIMISTADDYGFYEEPYKAVYKAPKFFANERLVFHDHLIEAEQIFRIANKRMEFFTPGIPGEKGYVKALHKEAIGYLHPLKSSGLKAIGGSISGHGFYSSTWKTHDIMYSMHLVFSDVGVTAYTGDFQGIDVDFNPLNYSFLKYYVCFRNVDEAIDHKAKLIFWNLELIGEMKDEAMGYSLTFALPQGLKIGATIKETVGLLISTDTFSMSYSPGDGSLLSSVRIRF